MLRPLVAQDFAAWRDVRHRNEAWLTPWEPRRPLAQFDPSVNREAFVSRCTARERDAAAGLSFGFGLFVDDRICGEVNVNHVLRGALQTGTIGYWIDERYAGLASSPRVSSSSSSSPSSGCGCTGWRSTSSRATPTAGG